MIQMNVGDRLSTARSVPKKPTTSSSRNISTDMAWMIVPSIAVRQHRPDDGEMKQVQPRVAEFLRMPLDEQPDQHERQEDRRHSADQEVVQRYRQVVALPESVRRDGG